MHPASPALSSLALLCITYFTTSANAQNNSTFTWGPLGDTYDQNRDGSPFLWLIEDDYSGKEFFDRMLFFTETDPTNGMVDYIPREEAFERNMTYVQDDGVVVIKADDKSELQMGEFRKSVRVETLKEYTTGLFILDLNTAPWGCGIWPAWWSTSRSIRWPDAGEIDIIEGVHDNEHNQVAWHTGPTCMLDFNETWTGNITEKEGPAIDCDWQMGANYEGCSITEWSRASYGPYFDAQGGGVFAMKWDENGIGVWSFYRSAVPRDITEGKPNPRHWGTPSAYLGPGRCDIERHFRNHTIIINITFCGDWAGASYASTRCPGTCQERLINPRNFENATWSINSLKVYKKQPIHAIVVNPSAATRTSSCGLLAIVALVAVVFALH